MARGSRRAVRTRTISWTGAAALDAERGGRRGVGGHGGGRHHAGAGPQVGPPHLLGEAGHARQVALDAGLADEGAAHPARLAFEGALALEGGQGLAQGHAAHAEGGGEGVLAGEAVARDQVPASDQVGEPAGDRWRGRARRTGQGTWACRPASRAELPRASLRAMLAGSSRAVPSCRFCLDRDAAGRRCPASVRRRGRATIGGRGGTWTERERVHRPRPDRRFPPPCVERGGRAAGPSPRDPRAGRRAHQPELPRDHAGGRLRRPHRRSRVGGAGHRPRQRVPELGHRRGHRGGGSRARLCSRGVRPGHRVHRGPHAERWGLRHSGGPRPGRRRVPTPARRPPLRQRLRHVRHPGAVPPDRPRPGVPAARRLPRPCAAPWSGSGERWPSDGVPPWRATTTCWPATSSTTAGPSG